VFQLGNYADNCDIQRKRQLFVLNDDFRCVNYTMIHGISVKLKWLFSINAITNNDHRKGNQKPRLISLPRLTKQKYKYKRTKQKASSPVR